MRLIIFAFQKIEKAFFLFVNNARVFIDYFRFDIKKYGDNLDHNKIELVYNLNNNKNN